jgi:hypothetical protein
MRNHQLTLIELLDDPMTRAVMAADRVDPAALKATLSAVARRFQHNFVDYQQVNCASWSSRRRFLTSLTDQEQFPDNGRICQMTASNDSHQGIPFVRHVLK